MRLIGLEPTRRETPDPKSGASTNFATGALVLTWCKDNHFVENGNAFVGKDDFTIFLNTFSNTF